MTMSRQLCRPGRETEFRRQVRSQTEFGNKERQDRQRFGEAETEGAAVDFGEVAGVVACAGDIGAEGAGLVVTGAEPVTVAEGAAEDEGAGLTVALPLAAGLAETEAPGTGVADATGTGVVPAITLLLRLLCVFAFRA
jgi:hypothetical protein